MPVAAGIYYHAYQRGISEHTPVVLIHGAGGTHLYWPPAVRRMSEFRVCALDLPGHGKTEGRGRQTMGGYAEAIIALLDEIGIYKAVFVGHSMGGGIAQTLAKDHPERVLGLGLVSTGARLRVAPQVIEGTSNRSTFPMTVDMIIRIAFSDSADERLKELAAKRMMAVRPSVLHGDFLACDTFDMMDEIRDIDVPSLVICGDADLMTPLRYAHYLADHLPFAKLEIVPGAGHMVMLEQPEVVARALQVFIREIPYQPGA